MQKILFLIGIILIFVTFVIYVLSLMHFFPRLPASLFLFLSILFTVLMFNNRHRFRGFDN